MLSRGPHEGHHLGPPGVIDVGGVQGDDVALRRRRLVAHRDPAGAVVECAGHPGGAHGVEGVHGGDQAETRGGDDAPQTRYGDLLLGHRSEEHVQGLLGNAVELLDVEEPTGSHRLEQRPVLEDLGGIAALQDQGWVEVPDEPGGGELGVALHEDEGDLTVVRDLAQQRGLAGARWAFEQHVGTTEQRGLEELGLLDAGDGAQGRGVRRRTPGR